MKEDKFVIVDSRTTCGNSVFFWCWDHSGYTVDLRMAGIYNKDEAEQICANRESDKMYPYRDVLKLVQHHVDIQDLCRLNKEYVNNPHTYSHLEVRNYVESSHWKP